jgi:hypothetical protein
VLRLANYYLRGMLKMQRSLLDTCHNCGKPAKLKKLRLSWTHFTKKYINSNRNFQMSEWTYLCRACLNHKLKLLRSKTGGDIM